MPILKSFLFVGPLVSLLLFGWSAYLEPAGRPIQAVVQPANNAEVFQPTPAPPLAEAEASPAVESPALNVRDEPPKSKPVHLKKPKVARAPKRGPLNSFAYAPQPFFFGWR